MRIIRCSEPKCSNHASTPVNIKRHPVHHLMLTIACYVLFVSIHAWPYEALQQGSMYPYSSSNELDMQQPHISLCNSLKGPTTLLANSFDYLCFGSVVLEVFGRFGDMFERFWGRSLVHVWEVVVGWMLTGLQIFRRESC